ncbi:MAG: MerR family transcriptional regulator [Betaproteobacteria bacterium]|nr:MerR family transcriptional regulator [Betaproteobacteria bacterium]
MQSTDGAWLPIRTVAALTGVNAVTLRAWERRYGLFKPVRTAKGHRLYTHEHVELIRRVLTLIERGVPVGQARQALAGEGPERKPASEPDLGPWRTWRERMAAAVARFDEDALDEVCDEALALHPVERVTRLLFMPVLAERGERWQKVAGGVAEEHFFSVYLRNAIGARFHHRHRVDAGPRLLAACLPGEQHEIGLLLFSLAAHEAGLRALPLGANVPLAELAHAAKRAACSAIVLSSSVEPAPETLSRELPALVRSAQVPVFVGGLTAERQRAALVAAGALALSTDIDAGVQVIAHALGVRAGGR